MARGAVNRKLSAKHTDEVIDAFNLFDADKDNRVNSSEILNLIKLLGGQVDCPHIQAMVKACDNNNEGSLGMEEFLEQWKVFKERVNEEEESEDEIKEAFRIYDKNGDGYITKEEMVAAITQMGFVRNCEEEATKCMEEMDLDKDGRVSYAEFVIKWRIS